MKRIVFLVAALMVLAVVLGGCVDQNEASEYCTMNEDFGLSHGECVSYFTSASGIAEFCKDNWEMYGFKNRGQCVSTINSWDLGGIPE